MCLVKGATSLYKYPGRYVESRRKNYGLSCGCSISVQYQVSGKPYLEKIYLTQCFFVINYHFDLSLMLFNVKLFYV